MICLASSRTVRGIPTQGTFSARKAIMQYAQLKKLPNVTVEGYLHRKRSQRAYKLKHVSAS